MISVTEAEKIILATAKLMPSETVPLTKAYGCILREEIKSDRDQPAFNKSTMDGITISYQTWSKGGRHFTIDRVIPAGVKVTPIKSSAHCVQIMTGAVVPAGCDCVVPIEQVTIDNKIATVNENVQIQRGQNIRYQAADSKKGVVVLRPGYMLSPPHVATAASFGKARIKVTVKAKVAIISTGDELVDISRKNIKPYQIRKSNSYALDAMLAQTNLCERKIFHLKDNKQFMLRAIKKILQKFDILVLSGGVSMGEFDYVPQVLSELGVEVLFHKVAQKPGKPFWFGKTKKGKAVFALPGNPVSTQVCAYRYVIPYLRKISGLSDDRQFAVLDQNLEMKNSLTNFIPVEIFDSSDGRKLATPVSTGGSGDYASLSQAHGFIELGTGAAEFKSGQAVPFYAW